MASEKDFCSQLTASLRLRLTFGWFFRTVCWLKPRNFSCTTSIYLRIQNLTNKFPAKYLQRLVDMTSLFFLICVVCSQNCLLQLHFSLETCRFFLYYLNFLLHQVWLRPLKAAFIYMWLFGNGCSWNLAASNLVSLINSC